MTNDAKYLFAADDDDEIQMIDIEKKERVYTFEEISEEGKFIEKMYDNERKWNLLFFDFWGPLFSCW